MKIQDSNVQLYAETSDRTLTSQQKFNLLGKNSMPFQQYVSAELKKQSAYHSASSEGISSGSYSDHLRDQSYDTDVAINTDPVDTIPISLSDKDCQRLTLLQLLLQSLIDKYMQFLIPKSISVNQEKYAQFADYKAANTPVLQYMQYSHYQRSSEFTFASEGVVTTADGREIKFDFSMTAKRQISAANITQGEFDMTDPLVLSFDGNLPALTDEKYRFDIDHDGSSDQISFLTGDSGFLALDKNEDGIINDGSELFGTESGSGFRDLSVYDSDSNGWIDENDPVFDGLRIWTKDEEGNDKLLALGEKGVGAIYLGSVASDYDLLASDNRQQGAVRESGIFLSENGLAGSVHHLDIRR